MQNMNNLNFDGPYSTSVHPGMFTKFFASVEYYNGGLRQFVGMITNLKWFIVTPVFLELMT